MTTQTEQALALLFRRFDDDAVPEDELVKVMSLTLGWTKPSRAVNLLERGVNAGLLDNEDGAYRAAFDPAEVDVPFGFEPGDDCFEPPSGAGPGSDPASGEASDQAPGQASDRASEETSEAPAAEAGLQDQRHEAPAGDDAAADPADGPPTGEGILEELLEAIAERIDGGRKRAVAAANAKQDEMGGLVTLDAAALLVAREEGVDVEPHADAVLDRLSDEAA